MPARRIPTVVPRTRDHEAAVIPTHRSDRLEQSGGLWPGLRGGSDAGFGPA